MRLLEDEIDHLSDLIGCGRHGVCRRLVVVYRKVEKVAAAAAAAATRMDTKVQQLEQDRKTKNAAKIAEVAAVRQIGNPEMFCIQCIRDGSIFM